MKCYVCKYLNANLEAIRHPNPTTIETARLLLVRVKRHTHDKREDHLCERHLNSERRGEDINNAFERAERAVRKSTPKKKGGDNK